MKNICDLAVIAFSKKVVLIFILFVYGMSSINAQEYVIDRILAGDPDTGDLFGAAVSMSGDWAIVGALNDDNDFTNAGAAYIFRREGGEWVQFQKIVPGTTLGAANDFFGMSVAISGETAIIGAYQDDGGYTNTGSAYIYRFDGAAWTFEQKLSDSNGSANDEFGGSVAISGSTALVGARYEDTQGSNAGAVFAYGFNGSSWTLDATLTVDESSTDLQFGNSVAVSGSIAVIGAYGDDALGSNAGAAYIFENSSSWTEVARITAGDANIDDQFGVWVAVNGHTAVIGARQDDEAASNAGAAYVFEKQSSSWTQTTKLVASDGAQSDQFGTVVSVSGDRILVGAPSNDDGSTLNIGAAYLFVRQNDVWMEQHKFISTDADEYDYFGNVLAIDNDQMIVGAHGNDEAAVSDGAAYMLTNTCCSPWQQKDSVLFYGGNVAIGECRNDVNLHVGGADTLVKLRVGNAVETSHETFIIDDETNGNLYTKAGVNDYVRIGGSGALDQGVAIIETGDNGNEPLLFRQKSNTTGVTESARMASNGYWGFGVDAPTFRVDLPNIATNAGKGRANNWETYSSIRWKENVSTLTNAMEKVRGLRGVEFDWKREYGGVHAIGFIAEEVATILPEVVTREADGEYIAGVSYQSIVPVLVEALKEMDSQLASLIDISSELEKNRLEIAELKKELRLLRANSSDLEPSNSTDPPRLFQSVPNPFLSKSVIRYYLPVDVVDAELNVTDVNGKRVFHFPLSESGFGSIEIPGSDLNAGVYLYSLFVDGAHVKTLKMVLAE